MSKHHAVLMYDSETKQWSHDVETENAKFPDGTIWDDAKEEWYSGYLGDGGYDPIDDRIMDYLPHGIDALNMLDGVSRGEELKLKESEDD